MVLACTEHACKHAYASTHAQVHMNTAETVHVQSSEVGALLSSLFAEQSSEVGALLSSLFAEALTRRAPTDTRRCRSAGPASRQRLALRPSRPGLAATHTPPRPTAPRRRSPRARRLQTAGE